MRVRALDANGDMSFGHGQAASGQGHAGDAVAADAALPLVAVQAVLGHQLVNPGFVACRDVGDDHVLVAGQAELSLVDARDFTHSRKQLQAVFVP